jgi:hypothetical protein
MHYCFPKELGDRSRLGFETKGSLDIDNRSEISEAGF